MLCSKPTDCDEIDVICIVRAFWSFPNGCVDSAAKRLLKKIKTFLYYKLIEKLVVHTHQLSSMYTLLLSHPTRKMFARNL